MSTISRDQQFRAYDLLRKLDTHTAQTMSQIAYGHTSTVDWESNCDQHRKVFEEWMAFAGTMHAPQVPNTN